MNNSGFIAKAACRGYRPSRFASHRGDQRPHLIARLAKERNIARFIVAPDGYGKTNLAIAYAETMFSWKHSFWLNAQSPCFLRDLDNGDIASSCVHADSDVKLVVIDDLPQLDPERAQCLSREIDELLAHKAEVIVTCVPSCDLMGGHQADRLRVGASDLLLTNEELDAVRTDEDRLHRAASDIPPAERVPVLVWDAQPASVTSFVAGCLDESLPADLLLASANAFAIHRGSIADLVAIGPLDEKLAADVFGDYPHLGFDVETGRFEAPLVDVDVLARAMKGRIGAMVDRAHVSTRDDLVRAWADLLLRDGRSSERACDLVRVFCTAKFGASWFLENARTLIRHGCFRPVTRFIRCMKRGQYDGKLRLSALNALCLRILGDEEGAVRCGKRCAFEPASPDDARIIGLLVVARLASGELRLKGASLLMERASAFKNCDYSTIPWYEALAVAWSAQQDGLDALVETWNAFDDAGVDEDVLCLVAAWVFTCMGELWDDGVASRIDGLDKVERYVRHQLSGDGDSAASFLAVSAGLSMEEAHTKGMPYCAEPLDMDMMFELRRAEVSVLAQRRAFELDLRDEHNRRSTWSSEGMYYGGSGTSIAPIESRIVPTLDLRLFGRLEVLIGGSPVDPRLLGRKQARVLLVLLAAYRGRDISRDVAAQALWPTRSLENAKKNFYSAWSQLRRALTLPDGTCPYLVRHLYGCRFDDRYVKSDLARLDDICRTLLFGKLDFEEWRSIYNELDRDFSGELAPVEEGSAFIAKVREDRRNRLVDALVAGSLRLIDAGNPQWAIWFSRLAVEHGKTREDAYAALMRAQIANNQRTAAMMTYFTCRRVLNEELGIDPSPELTALYESLLDS